ncbi:hypothetical protein SMSP2_02588 [Limihaloglobus sulfuriphilus]|uniref:Colicin V production protein n=1 Tax=Limihaloglobus sulfuriphilus TaxID=1851148 RepID=A0A1Q2MIS7_9BACT|nr:hypothetical protein [Limihaloglobus sulfuriphilus]AQQ72207.1 hypothetical protein SMSP2_02588 [Limihaloglobus sulfuriphilus]
MVFWISAVIALAAALYFKKAGFLYAWAALFNVVIAIYCSLVVTAALGKWQPDAIPNGWTRAAVFFVFAVIIYTILFLIAKSVIGSEGSLYLGAAIELCGGFALYFLTVFFAVNFVVFVLCITPAIEHTPFLSGFDKSAVTRSSELSVKAACGIVEKFSIQDNDARLGVVFNWLKGEGYDNLRDAPSEPNNNTKAPGK